MKIIAEIGWNFLGDLELAKEMIREAKKSGADVAKFQYWSPKYLKSGPWDSDGRREIYEKAALNEEKIKNIRDCCKEEGIESLFSAFNVMGAELLKELGETAIKIPSHEIANRDLIKYSGENFETVYLSTGASVESEVLHANDVLKKSGVWYNLMHCVSSYPCELGQANLERIKWLRILHENVGLSDHTPSTLSPVIARALGASVIEKHFTSNNDLPGRDNKFALNPVTFKQMVENLNECELMMRYLGNNYQESESDTVENYRGRWG